LDSFGARRGHNNFMREEAMKINEMTDAQLLASTKACAARERRATAALERVLQEVDGRRPGMRQGWPQRIDDGSEGRPAPRAPRRRRNPRQ
jgi:hypothetical protein